MYFVPLFLALIQKRQFEQSPDVRALARQSYEKRHERSVVLNALAIWVEIYCPCIATDNKGIGRDELANSHALGERVPIDLKLVAAINSLCARGRARDQWRQRRGRAGFQCSIEDLDCAHQQLMADGAKRIDFDVLDGEL